MRRSLGVLALVLVPWSAAAGQVVRGAVTARVSGNPIGGVLLELSDSVAARVATALSSEGGRFIIRAPRPGTYTLRARRIGFVRRTFGPFVIRADTALSLELESIPQALPAVTAVERSTCSQRRDEATATSVLWESANTALLSSDVTMKAGGYEFDFASHRRGYDLTPTRLTDVEVAFDRVRDVKPWAALPAAELAQVGFVHVSKERSLVFAAPDVDVLTHPSFVATHCFAVREEEDRPGMVGLEFRPTLNVEHADVRGTLWLSRESLELHSLDFTFVGLHFSGGVDTLAGGRVRFEKLPDGGWVPTEWVVRSPVPPMAFMNSVGRRAREQLSAGLAVALLPHDPLWQSDRVLVTGAMLLALRRAGDTAAVWRRASGQLDVVVNWRRGDRAVAKGLKVTLRGLGATAVTDDEGRASFAGIPPGEYILDTTSELQDLLMLPREVRTTTVRSGGVTRARLTAFPDQNAINTVCAFNGDRAVVAGVVTRDSTEQLWVRIELARATRDEQGVEHLSTVRTGWSGTGGRFHLCRIPRGETFVVLARYEDGTTVRKEVTVPPVTEGASLLHLVRLDFNAPAAPRIIVQDEPRP